MEVLKLSCSKLLFSK